MTLDEVLDEALGFFEAYRRLGFLPEQLDLATTAGGQVFLMLRAQGKSFLCEAGQVTEPPAEIEAAWLKRANAWNRDMAESERKAIWDRSFARRHAQGLVERLVSKGFRLPCNAGDLH